MEKTSRLPCYAFAFCFAAQRAFINTDNFFLAAALIGGWLLDFLGADFPFQFAHRSFIAAEIRLRAARTHVATWTTGG